MLKLWHVDALLFKFQNMVIIWEIHNLTPVYQKNKNKVRKCSENYLQLKYVIIIHVWQSSKIIVIWNYFNSFKNGENKILIHNFRKIQVIYQNA